MTAPTMDALRDGIAALHDEAEGLIVIRIIRPIDAPEMLSAALLGDEHAMWMTRAMTGALNHINNAPKDRPALCGCCPHILRSGFSICVATANRDDPHSAITFAICQSCGTEVVDIHEKAVDALHRIWPQAKSVPLAHVHGGGRA